MLLGILKKFNRQVLKWPFTSTLTNEARYASLVGSFNAGSEVSYVNNRLNLQGSTYDGAYVGAPPNNRSFLYNDFDLNFTLQVTANASGSIFTFDDNGGGETNLSLRYIASSGLQLQSNKPPFGAGIVSTIVPIYTGVGYSCLLKFRGRTAELFINGLVATSITLSTTYYITSQRNLKFGGFGATTSIYGYLDNIDLTLISIGQTVASTYPLDFTKIRLLLHFDGFFKDSSTNSVAMTTSGNMSIDATDTKFGSGKLRFGDSPRNGYLKTTNAFFNFGNQKPFTLCMWAKEGDGNGCYATTRDAAVYTQFELGRGGNFIFGNSSLSNWTFAPFSANTSNWTHIAVVGDGSRIKGYLNGVQQFDIAHPSWPSGNSFLQFGKNGDGAYSNGTLDEVLLYSEALWTSNFTPPSLPFS